MYNQLLLLSAVRSRPARYYVDRILLRNGLKFDYNPCLELNIVYNGWGTVHRQYPGQLSHRVHNQGSDKISGATRGVCAEVLLADELNRD